MEKVPMLDLKREFDYMKDDIRTAIEGCLEHQKWILGPEVAELEKRIAAYLGVGHCIGCSSGTDALVLSLRAMAIKLKGKEYFDKEDGIITTPFTFTATGDAILRAGATPVFVDIDPHTYNIDPVRIRECLSHSTNVIGIVPVHLYGYPCSMDEIMTLARTYGLFVVEDVAQAFGAEWRGSKLGSLGDAGCFSFFPSKNLGGFGDGGMVATNDDTTAQTIRMLTKHGGKDKYNVEHIGYNARLDTLQAAILLAKLKHLDTFNERRRHLARLYSAALAQTEAVVVPRSNGDGTHVYHQYTIRTLGGTRDALKEYLAAKGIDSMVYYAVPLHEMATFEKSCTVFGDLRETSAAAREVLSLPMEPLFSDREIAHTAESIKNFYSSHAGSIPAIELPPSASRHTQGV
ncbi:MAG: UDP-2-acetamido-2-deoxy-3-oxo-D-glucuronate aminotransferase [Syntrophorhabdaceae bacterium PtaU1.Bin034]|jgi:dTDP-4-amino-4,6-dideoxygalactose transaminase|nr:MAG: UDP-2-acetamido-2-deoxy-3-oxo-D-glucuronate aminotransferase [Syntrophorhabdaceae bacterium PtaU1.Bin034]